MAQTSAASFSQIAGERRPKIDAALDRCTRFGPDCPDRLAEAIRYSLLAPGKRLRPLLALMAAEACGGTIEGAMPAACAVEMVHTYSLIHDDLPAMDDDDLRRGRPTNHKVFGEGLAVLAGDALLTLAFEVIARDIRPEAVALRCCAALASAAGAQALVGGQADDLEQEMRPDDLEQELRPDDNSRTGDPLAALESIHRRKTGALILVSLELGAMTALANEHQMSALRAYGRSLGLAFQIMDDVLDSDGDEASVGKRVGKDANRGKLTFPGLLGRDASQRRALALTAVATTALVPLGPAAEDLAALARFVVERDR